MSEPDLSLTEPQRRFFDCVAAADMWNKKAFPDFVYFTFGLSRQAWLLGQPILRAAQLWELSQGGTDAISAIVKEGRQWYEEAAQQLETYLERAEVVELFEHRVLVVKTWELQLEPRHSVGAAVSHYLYQRGASSAPPQPDQRARPHHRCQATWRRRSRQGLRLRPPALLGGRGPPGRGPSPPVATAALGEAGLERAAPGGRLVAAQGLKEILRTW